MAPKKLNKTSHLNASKTSKQQQKGQQLEHAAVAAPGGQPEGGLLAASVQPAFFDGMGQDALAALDAHRRPAAKPPSKLKGGIQKPKAKKSSYVPVAARKALLAASGAAATPAAPAAAAASTSGALEDGPAAAPADLRELEHKLQQSLEQLREVERQVYNLETTYFESTNPQGNALLGYDGLLSNNSAKKAHFKPEDRIFSGSSTTGAIAA